MAPDTSLRTQLYLIRHGETAWNVERRMQGHGGVGLNEVGRRQAEQVARSLDGTSFVALYTSDLLRAYETAQIIGEWMSLDPQPDPRLRERDQGEWEGMSRDDIERLYPDIMRRMQIDPSGVAPPGGENFSQLAQRVTGALDEITARHPGQRVLVVSHGLAIGVARAVAEGQPLARGLALRPENAEVIRLDWPVKEG